MNKTVTIIGAVLMIISLFVTVFAFIVAGDVIGPNSDNIIHDTSLNGNEFDYNGDAFIMSIYAKGYVECSTFDLSLVNGDFEYFSRDCDSTFNEEGYTYLGELLIEVPGIYQIISSEQEDIVIVDDDALAGAGLGLFCGGIICFLGLILLVVGLILGGEKKQTIVYVQQPSQQLIQQPMQQQYQQEYQYPPQ